MQAVQGTCELCAADKQPTPSGHSYSCGGVHALFLTGYTIDQNGTDGQAVEEISKCMLPPLAVASGGNDYRANLTSSTFDIHQPPKVFTVLAELDHFSIADRKWLVRPDVDSPLPRAEQVKALTDVAVAWFDVLLALGSHGKAGAQAAAEKIEPNLLPRLTDVQLLRSNLTGLDP